MLDATEIALEIQSSAAHDWPTLLDRMSIPPAQVKRSVVFDASDPRLDKLPLPSATAKATATRDDPQPPVIVVRDQSCPDCGRSLVVVYKPWGIEPATAIANDIRGSLQAIGWHDRHPR